MSLLEWMRTLKSLTAPLYVVLLLAAHVQGSRTFNHVRNILVSTAKPLYRALLHNIVDGFIRCQGLFVVSVT